MSNLVKYFCVLLFLQTCHANHTESFEFHEREKRWLTFSPYGGVAKLIIGALNPVYFHHNKLVRSLNVAVNLQANYIIPATIIWPVPASIFKNRVNNDYVDNSRIQLYQILENMFDYGGISGRECVLRTICEIAETPLNHSGMFGELMDVMFTPYEAEHLDQTYMEARQHGLNGSNCVEVYKRCPLGSGLLEKLTVLHLFK
ncbi:AAEL009434-PA [Aedes aegypti]|uniref:AAEL009434-PA n=2 Tax=Aedes aegypti TaxID=7159 RepID=A0A1S4FMG8_AEDAE|nr:uncharacterized protein LOC5571957 [Aedes aegypti]EAT38687.1 AAEL009434-PA [Aedes aegypti]